MGNPLLDIIAEVDQAILYKYSVCSSTANLPCLRRLSLGQSLIIIKSCSDHQGDSSQE
jgi:hypothetical protein